jgi:hypothetical protein
LSIYKKKEEEENILFNKIKFFYFVTPGIAPVSHA